MINKRSIHELRSAFYRNCGEPRYGKFIIQEHLIREFKTIVQKIMSRVIVIEAHNFFSNSTIEYTALSDEFNICDSGKVIPEYDILIHESETGQLVDFEFVLVDEDKMKTVRTVSYQ